MQRSTTSQKALSRPEDWPDVTAVDLILAIEEIKRGLRWIRVKLERGAHV